MSKLIHRYLDLYGGGRYNRDTSFDGNGKQAGTRLPPWPIRKDDVDHKGHGNVNGTGFQYGHLTGDGFGF